MHGSKFSILGSLLIGLLILTPMVGQAHERGLSIDMEENSRIQILSETEAAEGEIDFRYRAETTGRPKLAVAAELETGNGTIEEETEVEFSATFREAFEFEDVNGNGVQDASESRLSTIRLEDLAYDPIDVVAHSVGNLDGFKVTLRGSQEGFTFSLVSYIFPAVAVVNGTPLPEQAVKVDILLEGYPFTSEDGILGLEVGVESTVEREVEFEESRKTIEVHTERGTAFFQWSPEAQVDGETVTVTSKWQSQGERLILYYPQGAVIIHDPILGFEVGGASPLLTATTFALISIVGLAVAGLAVALYVHKRRQPPTD